MEQLNVIQSLLISRETHFQQIAFLTEKVEVISKKLKNLESKYQKLTKQAQDAVIQRSLLSTEIARLKEELERN